MSSKTKNNLRSILGKLYEYSKISRLETNLYSAPSILIKLLRTYVRTRYEVRVIPSSYAYVDPNEVKYFQLSSSQTSYHYKERLPWSIHEAEKGSFHPQLYTGAILSGNWDKYKKPYELDRIYRGIKEHYQDGVPWEKTVLGQHYLISEEINNNEFYFEEQIKKTEQLYKSIKENGLLTPYEINEKPKDHPVHLPPYGIAVNIDRNGDLIYNNLGGHRRLAIARVLDLDKIPVLIVVRHSQYDSHSGKY